MSAIATVASIAAVAAIASIATAEDNPVSTFAATVAVVNPIHPKS